MANSEDKTKKKKEKGKGSSIGTVTFNNKKYAVNLLWNVAEDVGSTEEEAKAAAKNIRSSGFCATTNRDGTKGLYGLIDDRIHKAGQMVLVPLIAHALEHSFLGVFKLQGIWLMVGVDETGVILFDKAYKKEENAYRDFKNVYTGLKWEKVICPKSWNVANTAEGSLDNFVDAKVKVTKIKGSKLPLDKVIFALIALSVLGGGGYYMYDNFLNDTNDQQAQSAAQIQVAHRIKIPDKIPTPKLWVGENQGIPMIFACMNIMTTYSYVTVEGWQAGTSLTCDKNGMNLSFSKQGGTINWVDSQLLAYELKPTKDVFADVAKAKGTSGLASKFDTVIPLPSLQKYTSTSKGEDLAKVQAYLLLHFAELGKNITLSKEERKVDLFANESYFNTLPAETQALLVAWKKAAARPPSDFDDGYRVPPLPKISVYVLHYEFQTDGDPRYLLSLFYPLKANVLSSVSSTTGGSSWTIKGDIYGQGEDFIKIKG